MKKQRIILALSLLLTLTSCRVVSNKRYKNEVSKEDFYTKLEESLKAYEMEDIPSYSLEYYVKKNYKVVEYFKISNRTINSSDSSNCDRTYKYDSTTQVLEIRSTSRENISGSIGSSVINSTTHDHYQNTDGGSYFIDMVDSDYSFVKEYTYDKFAPFMQYIPYLEILEGYEYLEEPNKYYVDKNMFTYAIEYVEEVDNSTDIISQYKIEKKIEVQITLKKKGLTLAVINKVKKTTTEGENTKTENTNNKENYTLKFKKISMKRQDLEKYYFHD